MDEFTLRYPTPLGQAAAFQPRATSRRDAPIAVVRRFLIGFVAVLCIAVMAWPILPRRFEAAGDVILRPTDREGQFDSAAAMRQPLDENAVQSQMDLVSATPIVDAIIERHAIAADPEFTAPSALSRVKRWLGLTTRPEEPTPADLREAVRKHLLVARDRRSYTVRIGFASSSPAKASAIAHTLLDAYLNDQVARKRRAAEALFGWLELRVALLREKQEASAQAVDDHIARSGLVDRGAQISLDAQLVTLSQEAAMASSRAIEVTTRAATLAALQASNSLDSAPEVLASTTIQALKQNLSAALGRTVVMSPEQQAITEQIAAESARIVRSVAAEGENWRRREGELQAQIRAIRAALTERQKATMALERLQQEAANDRTALTDALARLRGQTANDGAQHTDVEVVSQPETPHAPAFPSLPLFALGTLLAACLGGAAMNARLLFNKTRELLEL